MLTAAESRAVLGQSCEVGGSLCLLKPVPTPNRNLTLAPTTTHGGPFPSLQASEQEQST